jgi:uncharacterized protein
MDRVFLDANVLFSASRRANSGVLWLWHRPKLHLLTSDYAVGEAERNLLAADDRDRLATMLETVEIVTSPSLSTLRELPTVNLPEKDQPILAAAINARATHLITGDKRHFGKFFGQNIRGVLIQTPAQFRLSKSRGK